MVALDKYIIPRAFIRGSKEIRYHINKQDRTLNDGRRLRYGEELCGYDIIHPPLPLQCIQSSVLNIPHLAMHIESFARHSPYI